ncbi:MAG: ferredoxin [Bdellovibrionales bacterium]
MTGDPPLFYKAHVFCCTNRRAPDHKRGCCAGKDAEHLRNYMKKRARDMGLAGVRVNNAGCLDRCERGPCIVIYPEGVWYAPRNEADCDEILSVHILGGGRVTRLMLDPA